MTTSLSLAYSPCPNDSYLFYALAHQKVTSPHISFSIQRTDIDQLNQGASVGKWDLVKVSLAHYQNLQKDYVLLPVGAAFGHKVGPLVVSSKQMNLPPEEWVLGLPGPNTTAHALIQRCFPTIKDAQKRFLPFHQVIDALKSKEIHAGVLVHESRFALEQHGLQLQVDLGKWWFEQTQLPVPLGGLCLHRKWKGRLQEDICRMLQNSLDYAQTHHQDVLEAAAQDAQEQRIDIAEQHIQLYVNEDTRTLSQNAKNALDLLFQSEPSLPDM